jgi:uncharacterized protein (TIGR02145 family)
MYQRMNRIDNFFFLNKLMLLFFICSLLLNKINLFSQDNKTLNFNYNLKDNNNKPIVEKDLNVDVKIFEDSINVYQEVFNIKSNSNGLVKIEVGGGDNVFGVFDEINFNNYSKMIISTRLTESLDSIYIFETKFFSVPYAFHSKFIDTIDFFLELDSTFLISPASNFVSNDIIIFNIDTSTINEIQQIYILNDTIFLTKSNFVKLVYDYNNFINKPFIPTHLNNLSNDLFYSNNLKYNDIDSLNEIQYLSLDDTILSLSDSNFILLNDELSENEIQNLEIEDNKIKISNSEAFVNLTFQMELNIKVSETNDTLYLDTLNSIKIPNISNFNNKGLNSELNYNEIYDIEGNMYKTILIGNQEWMAENLKASKFSNGDNITLLFDTYAWNTTNQAVYTYINNEIENSSFGFLYNWKVASDLRNVCPNGWRVPNENDWFNLEVYLGGESIAGGKLKSKNKTFWSLPNIMADNSSGFSAQPFGYRNDKGEFKEFKNSGYWWSSSENFAYSGWIRLLNHNDSRLRRSNYTKNSGCNIRCVKDF